VAALIAPVNGPGYALAANTTSANQLHLAIHSARQLLDRATIIV
jgi:hypothetical protein